MKWENNEIYCAAFGGFLIALSSVNKINFVFHFFYFLFYFLFINMKTIHLYTLGRVTGMSGIFRSIATFEKNAF